MTTKIGTRTLLLALSVVVLWASGFVGLKFALVQVPAGPLALARFAIASLVLTAILSRRGIRMPRFPEGLRLVAAGGIGIALYNVALNQGQQSTSAAVASLVINTVPLWTGFLSVILLGEKITVLGWAGSGLSFAGILVMALPGATVSVHGLGLFILLIAAISQALYFVITKPLLLKFSPLEVTTYSVWTGTLFLLPFSRDLAHAIIESDDTTLATVVFLGLGPAAAAYVAWAYVLKNIEPGRATRFLFLVPFVALGLEWMILGTPPNLRLGIGGAFILMGVAVSQRRPTATPLNREHAPAKP